MKKVQFIIFLAGIFLFYHSVLSQEHFTPVEGTGEYSSIVIEEVIVNSSGISYGDEIGVYDGNLCVGAVVFEGEFPLKCSAVMAFQQYPGAETGNPMNFKLWQQDENQEMDADPVYDQGGTFGDMLTVVEKLQASKQTGVKENKHTVPEGYLLHQNYPNPFNPATTITYSIPEAANIQVSIYTMKGTKIKTYVTDHKNAGQYSIVWNGKNDSGYDVSTGVYLITLQANEYTATKKVMLLH
ncbi:MAG: FlgD immunoglobulin-like domain containing protein [bacterium]